MKKILFLSLLSSAFISTTLQASICGPTDDRVLSQDPKIGRMSRDGRNQGCTVALISDKCAVTAGTCMASSSDFVEFNTPMSVGGVPMPSKAEDQYRTDLSFYEFELTKKIGENWAVVRFEKNPITNLYPGQAQGYYNVVSKKLDKNAPIRVVTYGSDDANGTRAFTQTTAKGVATKPGIFLVPTIIEFVADTSWGSVGASIISEERNELIGVTTHGGCDISGSNAGTYLLNNKKVMKAIAACLKE